MDKVKLIMLIATSIVFISILIANLALIISINKVIFPESPILSHSRQLPDQEAKEKEISNYKNLSSELLKQKSEVYDLIIIKTLLPLFTTLITGVFTYIIAKFGMQFYRDYLIEKQKYYPPKL